jgi:hypothetical protein
MQMLDFGLMFSFFYAVGKGLGRLAQSEEIQPSAGKRRE